MPIRSPKITQLSSFVRTYRAEVLIALLVIFYTVGTFGILRASSREQFLSLSFFNLLLSFVLLLLGRNQYDLKLIGFIVLCYITGLTVEAIGVHTGLLFGNYFYGENLGIKIMGIPLIIGVNWAMLVLTSGSFLVHFTWSPWVKASLAAALMTGLDALMEPVAMNSDYWQWENGNIPLYNYLCWYIISWGLLWVGYRFKLIESNKVSKALFILLVLFFTILNW